MTELFDLELRAMRRDRAARRGVEPFLFNRALADIVDRLALIPRRFERALLIGCLGDVAPLAQAVGRLEVRDPSLILAAAAGGSMIEEERWSFLPGAYDLIVTIGTLDTINALPQLLQAMHAALAPDGLLIGALSGGDSVPHLRSAMRAADALRGDASAHVHPRIAPSALAPLLGGAGFAQIVVDVDRVAVRYASLGLLVADLRGMGATNVLLQRPRQGLSRSAVATAEACFRAAGDDRGTIETFEILHFVGWAGAAAKRDASD